MQQLLFLDIFYPYFVLVLKLDCEKEEMPNSFHDYILRKESLRNNILHVGHVVRMSVSGYRG